MFPQLAVIRKLKPALFRSPQLGEEQFGFWGDTGIGAEIVAKRLKKVNILSNKKLPQK